MVKKNKISLLVFSLLFLLLIVLSSSFVLADCWVYSGTSEATCTTLGGADCIWRTQAQDPFCSNLIGCCMEKGCWIYAGTNETACTTFDENLSCMWDATAVNYPYGNSTPVYGACIMNWSSNDQGWNISNGCWSNDGNKMGCGTASGCMWQANDQNQDPWCMIKSLTDAQSKNPSATISDIGCCLQSGCWSYDSNQSGCQSAFQGNCWYDSIGGWCNTKSCSEIANEGNCTWVKENLMMPCNWTGSACSSEGYGTGGFGFYDGSTDSCFSAGGWYNSTGSCIMPTGTGMGSGSGGFMFANEAHCWFADNKPGVCRNISGCVYCESGSGNNGTSNLSSNNICANKQPGFCEGHNSHDINTYAYANNSANLACADIRVKTACTYGPLPNCKWTNSSVINGSYCEAGAQSETKSAPPVQYCEDPLAKNNFTLCNQLSDLYMMPCKWQNTTYPVQNCTFNSNAVFGTAGEKDFGEINSQFSCTSAGGSWNTEYYVDEGILKQDSWCEMTGMFDIDLGTGMNNKANCDTSCWACEFQNNGTAWASISAAQNACGNSSLGYCVWKTNNNSFNGQGFCDFPDEMESGGEKDCNLECEGCNFMTNPQAACEASMANNGTGCKWADEGANDYCVDKTKKTCSSDCFSCYTVDSCQNSSLECIWAADFGLCKPQGYEGEVCFDGIDNDGDSMIDCLDPDCGFDNFCGGSAYGGDCFAKTDSVTCINTPVFLNPPLNCTWINDTWNPLGWCDMPGANCWKFNDDLETCGITPGCTNQTTSMGASVFCDINMTKMNSANCWNYTNITTCNAAPNCQWKNDTWCQNNPGDVWCDSNPDAGWCEYAPNAACSNLNQSLCSANVNCTWKQDPYSMVGGWCDLACFNESLNTAETCNAVGSGMCEFRNMSLTCQPAMFMMMGPSSGGSGGGGGPGCAKYNGNHTACLDLSDTCVYKNDSYANNNVSGEIYSGWCMNKAEFEQFGEMEGNVIDLAMDNGNFPAPGPPQAETGVDGVVDIVGTGMRVTDEGFNFGGMVMNVSASMMCNGNMIGGEFGQNPVLGIGNQTTKFYWYLGTDGNTTSGCDAVPSSGANITGFDFLISYISRNTSSGISETKQMMRCLGGSWVPTNALVTTSKMISCGDIGGVMVGVSKQDLESFSEYNKTSTMRILMVSANETKTRLTPSDSVGVGYYTPGTIDFTFIDCSNPTMSKDPKCKNFQKFGFNVFEECKNGFDDDENGMIDCEDPFCSFIPDCNSGVGFNFIADVNDVVAPVVMFSSVETSYDAVFVRIDTSEPSNLSLDFFKNDSACATANLNITLDDTGTGYQANANFKPFHSLDLMLDTLGYSLINGTTYYYKTKVCDPSANCAYSACANFTTKTTATDKSFIFKMELPDNYTVDIPAFNKTNYNFTESFGGTLYDVGIKTNTSVTKSMNMTIHCGDMSIGFFGINILKPVDIDLSAAFICNETRDLLGMNSTGKKWNKLINDLHLGGAADYIEITMPIPYNAGNTFNWTDDSGTTGQNVTSYTSCTGNTTHTICHIPVSMGFSAYTITVPAATGGGINPSGSGGGGGGAADLIITEDQFNKRFTGVVELTKKIKFTSNNVSHYVQLNTLTNSTAKITVASTPQEVTLSVGDTRKFEIDEDGSYDLSVTLNNVIFILGLPKKANLTIGPIDEEITKDSIATEQEKEEASAEIAKEETSQSTPSRGAILLEKWKIIISVMVVVILIFIVFLILFIRRKNNRY